MRILITNDDGISAPGLKVLDTIAEDLAGPDGTVWTVAPAFEQSGVGHCISYTRPMMIEQLGPRRFAIEGSPADCVLAGLHEVLQGAKPDLILSGVNRGNNSAENALYSGTLEGQSVDFGQAKEANQPDDISILSAWGESSYSDLGEDTHFLCDSSTLLWSCDFYKTQ